MEKLSGLTRDEEEVLELLVNAYTKFTELPVQRKHDIGEFVFHVHGLQKLLAIRHMRREFPNFWISEEEKK